MTTKQFRVYTNDPEALEEYGVVRNLEKVKSWVIFETEKEIIEVEKFFFVFKAYEIEYNKYHQC